MKCLINSNVSKMWLRMEPKRIPTQFMDCTRRGIVTLEWSTYFKEERNGSRGLDLNTVAVEAKYGFNRPEWARWLKRHCFWRVFWRCLVRMSAGTPIIIFLIGIVGGGVQLGLLGTAATNRPIVPAQGD
jgi:hypothetical protein